MNAYDEDLFQAFSTVSPSGADWSLDVDTLAIFNALMRVFPASGSKVDWARVPGAFMASLSPEDSVREAVEVFSNICRAEGLQGRAVYVGDSATEVGIASSIDVIKQALPAVLGIPQHHYVLAPDAAWCFSFTMEGDVAFGYAPRNSPS